MNQNRTVSVYTVSECTTRRQLHSLTTFSLKRESMCQAQMFTDYFSSSLYHYFVVVKYSLKNSTHSFVTKPNCKTECKIVLLPESERFTFRCRLWETIFSEELSNHDALQPGAENESRHKSCYNLSYKQKCVFPHASPFSFLHLMFKS